MFTEPLASLLSFFYDIVPSYAAAISMLTIAVMLVVLPLTLKGTRSMLAMQRLSPEIKKLQDKHKNDRQKLNEEVMALYKDNNIKPLGGCLPLILQLPVFFLLYQVIAGLTSKKDGVPQPKYLEPSSRLYQDLVSAGGKMESFGIDLSLSAGDKHGTFLRALPYILMLVLMVALQYVQQWQISSKTPPTDNPQAQQMRTMQKFFPPFFGVISWSFPAGVVVYWVVSSLFRVTQQWAMYRYDPVLKTTVASAKKEAQMFLSEDEKGGRATKALPKGTPSKKKNSSKKKNKGR